MAFTFRLETRMGDPPTRRHSARRFSLGVEATTIPLGQRILRVVDVKDDDADQAPVLVVEDMHGPATGDRAA